MWHPSALTLSWLKGTALIQHGQRGFTGEASARATSSEGVLRSVGESLVCNDRHRQPTATSPPTGTF